MVMANNTARQGLRMAGNIPRGMFGSRPNGQASPPLVPADGGATARPGTDMAQPNALDAIYRKPSTWQMIAGTVGDALLSNTGSSPIFAPTMLQRQQEQRQAMLAEHQRQQKMADWRTQEDYKASLPEYFMSGEDRIKYDPVTGQSTPIYDAPDTFERYAAALGLQPGTDEYNSAMQDYVLKSSGPTAYGYDMSLDDHRTQNDIRMDAARTQNNIRQRSSPTYANLHPTPRSTRGGGGGGSARQTATGPNGQKVEWNGKAWVPAR